MKRRTWITAGAATAAALAFVAWAFAPRPVDVEPATAVRARFETSVEEDGKTRLRDRYVVSAPLAGQVERVQLREGDAVTADDVVASMTPVLSPLLDERSLREQQLRVETAQAQVVRAEKRVESAGVALQQAGNEVRRNEVLAVQGFVSATRLESDRLAALAAQKDLDVAVQERHIAEHEVAQARAALMAVQRTSAGAARSLPLRSPVSGRVLRIVQTSEAVLPMGSPVLELGDTQALEVVSELLTGDALKATPGSPVVIERWGGDKPLKGSVRRVEPSAFTKVSALGVEEQRVKVLIDITSPFRDWASLGDGFRVGVRILTSATDGVIVVPVSAVFPVNRPDGTGGMAVFRVENGRARLTPVTLGGRNSAQAWIREGLSPGDTVVVYPPSALRDGARVTLRHV